MRKNYNSGRPQRSKRPERKPEEGLMVHVYDNDVNKALRRLKRKIENSGIIKTIHEKKAYEKPSDKRRRLKKAAKRRWEKKMEKRKDQLGY
jgi:small subunit ribosomal protein S21